MVSAWEVGGEYELRLKVKQTSADPEMASFEVIEATDETSEAEPEEEGETMKDDTDGKEATYGKKGKSHGKPAIVISFK